MKSLFIYTLTTKKHYLRGLLTFLLVVIALLTACTQLRVEPPTAKPTAELSVTMTMAPSPTMPPIRTIAPEPSATPQLVSQPTLTNTRADSIEFFLSFIGSHQLGDKYYFHFIVLDKDAEFVPKTTEVIDPMTNQVVGGPFILTERPDFHLCAHLAFTGGKFYGTDGIDTSQLPPDFWYRLTQEPFLVFRVTVQGPSGGPEVLNIVRYPGICQSESE